MKNISEKNTSRFSNHDLHYEILNAARAEKRATFLLLEFLHEVDRRRLHLERGFSSLFSYVTAYLGYSESQAQERISAMRLAFKIPEIRESLEAGRLNLKTTSLLATHARKARLTVSETMTLLPQVENRSKREIEKIFAPPNTPQKQAVKIDDECSELLRRFKELEGDLSLSTGECLKRALKVAIDTKIKKHVAKRPGAAMTAEAPRPKSPGPGQVKSRYIPIRTRQKVLEKSGGTCQYHDALTGRRCDARHGLQFEHKLPFARGGPNSLANLEILCANHNQFRAQLPDQPSTWTIP